MTEQDHGATAGARSLAVTSNTSVTDSAFRLSLPPYRRWYRFGCRSPYILWKRLNWHPFFRARMMWQRARRGWSIEDAWGFHDYLAEVIAGGVGNLRQIAHGHPSGTTYDEWLTILAEIEQGFRAATNHETLGEWQAGDEEAFDKALVHLRKWWFHLWD